MINLADARALANAGAGGDAVTVSRRWLKEIVDELSKLRDGARSKPVKSDAAK